MKKLITTIVYVTILSFGVKATAGVINFSYTGYVNDIEKVNGYWWMATNGGLVRYDSQTGQIKIFNKGNCAIPSNHIKLLAQDENGILWLGTENGVGYFDGTNATTINTSNSNILSDNIKLLDYEKYTGLWVVTDTALSLYDGSTWHHFYTDDEGYSLNQATAIRGVDGYGVLIGVGDKVELMSHDGSFMDEQFPGNAGIITGLGFDFLNNVVVAGVNGVWISGNGGTWTHYTDGNSPMPTDVVYGLEISPAYDLYFIHPQQGFSVLHRDNTWHVIPGEDGNMLNYHSGGFYAGNREVAFGLSFPWYGVVFGQQDDIGRYTFSDNISITTSPVSSNDVQNIVIYDGNKYISTWWGVDVLDRNNVNINSYQPDTYGNKYKYVDRDAFGNIWFAIGDGDVVNPRPDLYKIENDQLIVYNDDSLGVTNPVITGLQWETNKNPNGDIYGTLWISVSGYDYSGIMCYDSVWHKFPNQHPDYPGDFDQFVRDVTGTMWFAGNSGIYSYKDGAFTSYWYTAPVKYTSSVIVYRDGNLWFGGIPDEHLGFSGGIAIYDDGNWSLLSSQNSDLPDDEITSLAMDTIGNVWAGTRWGGLVKIDTLLQMKVFNKDNSFLDNNYVVKVAVDPLTNDIWILNYDAGVFVYNEQQEIVNRIAPEKNSTGFELKCFPNPFTSQTKIEFNLQTSGETEVSLYDLTGRKIKTILRRQLPAGKHVVTPDTGDLPQGVYLCNLKTAGGTETVKVIKR